MKNRIIHLFENPAQYHCASRGRERLIATFGRARLVCARDGLAHLRGGQAQERTSAKEWVSLFMHEAVVRFD